MRLVSIREILISPEKNPDTWFYLPPDESLWTLETKGVFSLNSLDFPPDSDEYLPRQAKDDGWLATLDKNLIEDIIENAADQTDDLTIDKLFEAFVFYYYSGN